jgi:hypothetical protein
VIVIGGQKVPDHTKHVWWNLAKLLPLKPIDDPSNWIEWAECRWHFPLSRLAAEILTAATDGNPSLLSALVERLAQKARA